MSKQTAKAIRNSDRKRRLHFNAEHASAEDLEDFKIEEMVGQMKELAPDLWSLIQILLTRDEIDAQGDFIMEDLDEFDESGEFVDSRSAKERETIRNIVGALPFLP
ncbi:hypothetical protein R3P38DRAFT_3235823 [Favolaschia claudopus]|uniref:Uncharacterized protein n=1 Tax=Favolaschia claudopus TaxID=2862362 RepID=A0AAV9ZDU1_9AGAR